MADFETSSQKRRGAIELIPVGRLTIDTSAIFEKDYRDMGLNAEEIVIGLNLSNIAFMDSSGVGALIRINQETKTSDKQLLILDLHPDIERLFRTARLSDVMTLQTHIQFDQKYPELRD